ncbi:hypothetical protein J7E38_09730 [Bacillus sp. ISL-35]|uniref:hypothetical protein n=1 Tax=Bacillus sp. ISL-35 TaxID=2819122 RepID=UPI001BE913B6|nr:hypothetical protein [Bacillus sp. ISL-35]MBT2679283.1 hypothetical protein [Bacillus sp. ISL-35]MBT2703179.1 hypothetical protein [Chryseobacterium sp. ISL-80]
MAVVIKRSSWGEVRMVFFRSIFKGVGYIFIFGWLMGFLFNFVSAISGFIIQPGMPENANNLIWSLVSILIVLVSFLINRKIVLDVIGFCLTFGFMGYPILHGMLAMIPTFLLLFKFENNGWIHEVIIGSVLILVFIFVVSPFYQKFVKWYFKKKERLLEKKDTLEPVTPPSSGRNKKKRKKKKLS